jgi:hypothetical protein
MRNTVGISHRLKRGWLDDLLDRLVQTRDEKELRAFVDQRLRDELPGKNARAKAVGILLRVWSGVEPKHVALRDRAVALLPRISGQERIWLHWGMAALTYPFFRDLAEVIGRMLTLQDDITNAQVQTRLKTAWGDRETSKEAAGKLITSMVDWEVLRATKTKGHFLLARKMTTSVTDLQLWLLEAMLSASASEEIEAHQLLRLPELFPFSFTVTVGDLRRHEGFNIHRQGLDMDMVSARQVKVEPPPKPPAKAKKPKKNEQPKQEAPTLFDEPNQEVLSGGDRPTALPAVPITDALTAKKREDVHMTVEGRSLFKLAAEEEKNLNRSIQVLGDTYDLVTDIENVYVGLPPLCRIPNDVKTNDASFAAGLSGNLMVICRRQLTLGTLTLLRGYRNESLLHLRKAIETCAYTARMEKHPHMARVWIQAGIDEESFERFRKKFVKLFPDDDPLIKTLGKHYDVCSKAMHSSIYGLAHYLAQSSKTFPLFDVGTNAKLVATFMTVIAAHLTMIRVFERLLTPYAGDGIKLWVSNLNEAEKRFRAKHEYWQPLIMAESQRLKDLTNGVPETSEESML